MKDFLTVPAAFFSRAWDKTKIAAKFVWEKLVMLFAFLRPKICAACVFVKNKSVSFFKTVSADPYKLILAIILTVAVLCSAIAVVKAATGIVNGVIGIFAKDEEHKEENTEPASPAQAIAETSCENCQNGVCIHCTDGFVDCPDCTDGFCDKCGGTGENSSKMLALLIDNCTACKGTGDCDKCDENHMIDCTYCDGGKCINCK